MKKLLLVAVVVAAGLTSCKKDYTCECVTKTDGLADITTTVEYTNYKKNDAETACEGTSITTGTTTMTCTLQ